MKPVKGVEISAESHDELLELWEIKRRTLPGLLIKDVVECLIEDALDKARAILAAIEKESQSAK